MANTSIIINSTDALGKSSQKTFTDVNPKASNEQLAALGSMLNAVSSNTYQGTTRIDKTDCDTEQKTARSITYQIDSTEYTPGTVHRKALSTLPEYSNNVAGYLIGGYLVFASKKIAWQSVAYVNNIVTTAGETTAKIGARTTYGNQNVIHCNCALNDKKTCTFHYDVVVPETDTYQEWRQTISVEVYDDSENP